MFPMPSLALGGAGAGGAAAAGIPGLGPALAIGGGLLSFFGTRSQNKALMAANDRLQKRLTDEQTSRETSYILNADAMAKQTVSELESARLMLPEGQSANEFLASYAGKAYLSKAALKQTMEQELKSLQFQKEEIANKFGNQMQSPLLAALTGAASGFGLGMDISDSFSRLDTVRRAATLKDSIGDIALNRASIVLGGMSAMEAIARSRRNDLASRVSLFGSSIRSLR